MKTKLFYAAAIFFMGCSPSSKQADHAIVSDLEQDFPITEKLEFQKTVNYQITEVGFSVIDNSALWLFPFEPDKSAGSCYDLISGKKNSDIAFMGRTQNEISSLDNFQVSDDVVAIQSGRTLKLFSKKQILENLAMEDRIVSVVKVPDSIMCRNICRLPNGVVVATLDAPIMDVETCSYDATIAVLAGDEVRFLQTIEFDSFGWAVSGENKKEAEKVLKREYAQGEMVFKDENIVAHFMNGQFVFYTLDIKQGKVLNEKRYTEVGCSEDGTYLTNEKGISIVWAKANTNHIACLVEGYLTAKEREAKTRTVALYVFDWDLNPLKKFELSPMENGYYIVDEMLENVYSCEFSKDGLTLYKAPLSF